MGARRYGGIFNSSSVQFDISRLYFFKAMKLFYWKNERPTCKIVNFTFEKLSYTKLLSGRNPCKKHDYSLYNKTK